MMRKVRTVDKLLEYLISIDCPLGRSTVSKLIREKKIPHIRIAERVLIFDLDDIDAWLKGSSQNVEKESRAN